MDIGSVYHDILDNLGLTELNYDFIDLLGRVQFLVKDDNKIYLGYLLGVFTSNYTFYKRVKEDIDFGRSVDKNDMILYSKLKDIESIVREHLYPTSKDSKKEFLIKGTLC